MPPQRNNLKSVLAPAIGLLTALVAFAFAFVLAPTVLGQTGQSKEDDNGPITPRMVVASGQTEHFGRWEMVASKNMRGESCVGVRLLDPAPGDPSLAEGCGGAVEDQVGTIAGSRRTLFFGRVDARTERVDIADRGVTKMSSNARDGTDGAKYVVTEANEDLSEAEITSIDDGGRRLGRIDPGAKR